MATITAPRSAPKTADIKLNGTVNGAVHGPSPSPTNLSWGNAGPIALLSFGVVTFMLSMVNANAISGGVTPVILSVGLVFGGITQMIAGLIQLRSGNVFQGVLFTSFGAFWVSLAAILEWYVKAVPANQVGHALGLFIYAFAFVATVMLATSFRTSVVSVISLVFLLVTLLLLGAGNYGAHTNLIHLGGYTGLGLAGIAFYLALAELCEYSYGRTIVPLWSLAKK
jgi:uncharacterized protein